jgi:hypothetical protein
VSHRMLPTANRGETLPSAEKGIQGGLLGKVLRETVCTTGDWRNPVGSNSVIRALYLARTVLKERSLYHWYSMFSNASITTT